MSLLLTQSKTALGPNLTASFLAGGGTAPYVYSVVVGGAGGTIDSASGLYTAPATVQNDPSQLYDTIQVIDSASATASAKILVGSPFLLFCEIIENQLGLAPGRVFIWGQKNFQPSDSGLYIAVSIPKGKPFGNTLKPAIINGSADWSMAEQSINVMATLDLDIISRSTEALTRKEEVLMALESIYSQAQQEANSFSIGRIPAGSQFMNLAFIDGAAIPYRFRISVNMQYFVTKTKAVDYFDTFQNVPVVTEP